MVIEMAYDTSKVKHLEEKIKCRKALERIADSLDYIVDWLEEGKNIDKKKE